MQSSAKSLIVLLLMQSGKSLQRLRKSSRADREVKGWAIWVIRYGPHLARGPRWGACVRLGHNLLLILGSLF